MISSLARSVKSRCRYCGPASNSSCLSRWPLGQSDRRRASDRVGSSHGCRSECDRLGSGSSQAFGRLRHHRSRARARGPGPSCRWHAVGPCRTVTFSGLSPRTCQRPKPVPAPGSGLSQLTCWIRDDQWPGRHSGCQSDSWHSGGTPPGGQTETRRHAAVGLRLATAHCDLQQ